MVVVESSTKFNYKKYQRYVTLIPLLKKKQVTKFIERGDYVIRKNENV